MTVRPPAALIEKDPELVGTLLGGRPSAVLRTEKQLATVPVGGKLGSWKVVSVNHGEAVLRTGSRTIHLGVSSRQMMGSVKGSEVERQSEVAEKKLYHSIPRDVAATTVSQPGTVTEPDRESLPDASPASTPVGGTTQPVKDSENPAQLPPNPKTPADDKSAPRDPGSSPGQAPGTTNPVQPAPTDKPPAPGNPQTPPPTGRG